MCPVYLGVLISGHRDLLLYNNNTQGEKCILLLCIHSLCNLGKHANFQG